MYTEPLQSWSAFKNSVLLGTAVYAINRVHARQKLYRKIIHIFLVVENISSFYFHH